MNRSFIKSTYDFTHGMCISNMHQQEFNNFIKVLREEIIKKAVNAIQESNLFFHLTKNEIKVYVKIHISYKKESALIDFSTVESTTAHIIMEVAEKTIKDFTEYAFYMRNYEEWWKSFAKPKDISRKTVSKDEVVVQSSCQNQNQNPFDLLNDNSSDDDETDNETDDETDDETEEVVTTVKNNVVENNVVENNVVENEEVVENNVVENNVVENDVVENEEVVEIPKKSWADYSSDEEVSDDENISDTIRIAFEEKSEKEKVEKNVTESHLIGEIQAECN